MSASEGSSPTSDWARARIGAFPGVDTIAFQPEGQDGTSPARTNDVFPAPEGPMSASNGRCLSLSHRASTSASRPKNRSASVSVNDDNPGYGPRGSTTRVPVARDGSRELRTVSRATATSLPEEKRSDGCFPRHRRTTVSTEAGISGRKLIRLGGSSRRMDASTSAAVPPPNARCPARSSYSIAPSANTSARAPAGSPFTCSGAM